MQPIDIFNELSEHIFLKINSCQRCFHEAFWGETRIHKDYDLWFVERGTIFIGTNDKVYTAQEGDFVLYYPDTPYHTYTEDDECDLVYIHFDFAIGNNLRILDDFDFSGIISGDQFEEKALFLRAYNEYINKTPMSALLLKGSLTALISRFVGALDKHRDTFGNYGRKEKGAQFMLLAPVFEYVSANIEKKITNAELSEFTNFSEKYFIRFFKNALGISPIQFVTQLKMNQAKKYIYEGNYTVKQLADMLGYSDPYSFSKAFKKHFKVSPTQFK